MITLKEFNWLIKHSDMDEETCKIYNDRNDLLVIKDKDRTIDILSIYACPKDPNEPDKEIRILYFYRNDGSIEPFKVDMDEYLGKPPTELINVINSIRENSNERYFRNN